MRLLDDISHSTAMSLSKLREVAEDRQVCVLLSMESQRVGRG